MPVLRAVVRDELAGVRPLALAAVTAVDDQRRRLRRPQRRGQRPAARQRPGAAAGPGRRRAAIGLSAAPRVGDTVVVAFVGGDLNGPSPSASLHDDQRHPPKAEPDEVVYEVPDDGAGVRRVEIVTASGQHGDRSATTTVKIVMGGTTLEIAADGAVTVEAATDFVAQRRRRRDDQGGQEPRP